MTAIIVDDDNFICTSLTIILKNDPDIDVVAVGISGEQAICLYESHHPDVLLMDIRMGQLNGLEAAEIIIRDNPEAKIIFLTTFADDEYIVKALRTKAKGYLIKQNADAIAPAIKAVMSGQSVFGSEVTSKLPLLIDDISKPDLSRFSIVEREMEIIELVAKGLNNREIADRLFLSEGTVRNYLSTILEKLEIRDRTQLAVMYYKSEGLQQK
ncbi:MAG: response regulator transcription factor [Oscillospiraceae bacterium]|nr:response regulator transcription factor [Oscillospiraceae bacterium]